MNPSPSRLLPDQREEVNASRDVEHVTETAGERAERNRSKPRAAAACASAFKKEALSMAPETISKHGTDACDPTA
jgi:hypothetical protein